MVQKKVSDTLGVSSLILTSFLYGFYGILTRIIGFQLPLFYQSWVRGLFCLLVLLLPLFLLKQWSKIVLKDLSWIVARTAVGVVAFSTGFIAFNFISIGTAYFVYYGGSTIGGYILGRLLFDERFTRRKIVSLLFALSGLGLIYAINFSSVSSFYIILAFISGLSASGWNTFSKKVSDSYSSFFLNFLDHTIFFIMMLVLSLVFREQWQPLAVSTPWIGNLLYGIMYLITGQLIVYGFKHVDAQTGSLLLLLEVIFGTVLGYLIFQETISFWTILGGVFIILSIVVNEIHIKEKIALPWT